MVQVSVFHCEKLKGNDVDLENMNKEDIAGEESENSGCVM